MQNLKSPLSFSVTDTIRDIPKQEWDSLFGHDIVEGYGYQRALEEAALKEFTFGYLLGKREKEIRAIIPFFIMDFSFDLLINGPLHGLAVRLKPFLTLKVLFIGCPTKEELYMGISKEEGLEALIEESIGELKGFCKTKKISGVVFYDISDKSRALIDYLAKNKFIRLRSLPNTLIDINVNSLEDYINGLSKNMRKDIRRKIRRSEEQTRLTTVIREDIDDVADRVYSLYMNNFDDSGVHFEVLTKDFFRNICRNMPGIAKFFLTYDKEKLVAFNLCLTNGTLFIDKFIGFDYSVAHKYHLYYTTLCHNIDWCIKNGFRLYQTGTTDYHPKIRLGAKLLPLYMYVKAFNPVIDFIIRIAAPLIEPRNIDPSLKEIKE